MLLAHKVIEKIDDILTGLHVYLLWLNNKRPFISLEIIINYLPIQPEPQWKVDVAIIVGGIGLWPRHQMDSTCNGGIVGHLDTAHSRSIRRPVWCIG